MILLRTAARKNCLARPQNRRAVFSARRLIRSSRNSSASPGVIAERGLSAPKNRKN